jgi:DASS family divalent anion:Na+ symporter
MGAPRSDEKVLLIIFLSVCGLWVTSGWNHLHITLVPMLGVAAMSLTGILTWHDVITEQRAWDVFIWYGGLMRMGEALNEYGVTAYFSKHVGAVMSGWHWPATLLAVLLIYFYSHYGFASITAHLVAMYAPFLALLIEKGVPAPLAAFSLAYFANLDASLTHYGTTPGPIIFGTGYVDQVTWWRLGFYIALAHLVVWTVVGFAWWKLLGLW